MTKLIAVRLLAVIPMLIGLSIIAFSLLHLSPTDPTRLILGGDAGPEAVAALRSELGLDDPLPVQFWAWFQDVATGDLGVSLFTPRPVLTLILSRLPVTLSLMVGTIVVATLIGMSAGVLASLRQGRILDRSILLLASVGTAIPGFWVGLLLSLAFAVALGWFPLLGYTRLSTDPAGWIRHLVLPVAALSVRPAAIIARQTRNSMVEVLGSDYIQAVRARGLSHRTVIGRYVLRNGMVPVTTTIGVQATTIIVVSFVMERVFSLPGVGTLVVDAVVRSDFPVVQGTLLLIGGFAILSQLLVDVGYGMLNPRARPQ